MKTRNKNLMCAAVLAVLACAGASSHAGSFGLPSLGGGASTKGADVGTQVGEFMKSSEITSGMVASGAVHLLQAVSSKEHGAELQKQLDVLGSIKDPKEQAAQTAALMASVQAELATQQKSTQTQEELKNSSDAQKKSFKRGLFDVALGLYKLSDLKNSAQGIVSGVSKNPMDLPKVLPVKDTLPALNSLLTNGKSIMESAVALARAADIKPTLPTSASTTAPQDADL